MLVVHAISYGNVTLVFLLVVQKNVREMYDVLYHESIPSCHSCVLPGGRRPNVFNVLVNEPEIIEKGKIDLQDLRDRGKVRNDDVACYEAYAILLLV